MPCIDDEEFTSEENKKISQYKIGATEGLLDRKDGGKECSEFRLYQKLLLNNQLHHLIHCIDIKPMEVLKNTTI